MQITCPRCGKRLPLHPQTYATQIRCGGCQSLIDVPAAHPQGVQSFPVHPDSYRNTSISDKAIIITAVSCVSGLIVVIGMALAVSSLTTASSEVAVEPIAEPTHLNSHQTEFQEGYSMTLPAGFKQQSRDETERGYIVYRYRSVEGYRFTLAILPNEAITRRTNPPREVSNTLVKSIPELSAGIDADIQPVRVSLEGMPATVFRYYEKETFRGVTFTYIMVAMDRERKIVMRFSGKYGGYNEQDDNITMPDEWYDSLLSFHGSQY